MTDQNPSGETCPCEYCTDIGAPEFCRGYFGSTRAHRPVEQEAVPVAWRWRNKPDGVWNYQEDRQRINTAEHHPLYAASPPSRVLSPTVDRAAVVLLVDQLARSAINNYACDRTNFSVETWADRFLSILQPEGDANG